jgi:hypothetical protein
MRPSRSFALLLAMTLALGGAWAWAQPERPTSAQATTDARRSELPSAVVKTLDLNSPGAVIGQIDVEDQSGIKVYDVEFKADRGEIEVAADGKVLEGPRPLAKQPAKEK